MTPVPIECKSYPDGTKPTTRLTISKNYVVPPRPKPGRKPSLEAPASKRKAQNRESQRIYRERKAVAVKQLEAQIADQAQEFERKQKELQMQIDQLMKQNQKSGDQNQFQNQSQNQSRNASNSPSPRQDTASVSASVASVSDTSDHNGTPTTPYIPLHAAAPSPPAAYYPDMGEYPGMGRYLYPPNVHAFNSMNGGCPSPGDNMIPITGYAIGPPGSSPIPIGMSPLPLSHPISMSPLGQPVLATPMSPADVVGLELLDHVLDQKLPVGGSNGSNNGSNNSSNNSSASSLSASTLLPQPSDAKSYNNYSNSLDSPRSLQAINSPKPSSPHSPNSPNSPHSSRSSHSPNSPRSPRSPVIQDPTVANSSPKSAKLASSKRYEPPATTDPLELMASEWSAQAKPLKRSNGPLEIDFTNKFRTIPRPLVAKADRCGFCTGDNVCVCAEAALREAGDFIDEDTQTLDSTPSDSENLGLERRSNPSTPRSPRSPNSPRSPSERATRDIGSSVHKTTRSSPEAVCSGDPGACERCQEDPMLSLFCAALAAKESVVSNGTFISPLQAYKTLKRHPNFSGCDLGAVIRELNVGLRGQVDVSSIAKCLRILD